jgi:hypothetical protein
MKILVQASVPTERGNTAVTDGTLQKTIQDTAQKWHPEAMYFTAIDGKRSAIMVVDIEATDIPSFAEPLFQNLSAEVSMHPVMSAEDLSKGLGQLAEQQ